MSSDTDASDGSYDDMYDAVVVGAGFAGLTAARELSQHGFTVAVVESRDRVGGRTWFDRRMGLELEIGGTWVHWTQPFVWSELQRYGIGVYASPTPDTAHWWDGRQANHGSPDRLIELLDLPNLLLTRRARECFPSPFDCLDSELLASLDGISVAEQIEALDLPEDQKQLLRSFWTLNFNGRLEDAALTQALRWVALTNGDWKVNFEACATYKIRGGTRRLAEAMAADIRGEVLLGSDVRRIDDDGSSVTVELADARTLTARHVVVTVPLHAMNRVEFTPALDDTRTTALERGQVGLGTKIWIALEGERPPFVALGGADWPLTFFQTEYVSGGRTYVVCFGPDASAIDATDTGAVQKVLRRLVPDAVVAESASHDWVGDAYAGETWPMHRTGFLSGSLAALRSPHGRIRFAGSDLAGGWGGFIDGAIQSGLDAAGELIRSTSGRAGTRTTSLVPAGL